MSEEKKEFFDLPELTPQERIEGLLKTIESYKELIENNNQRFERDKTDIINQWMLKVQSKDDRIKELEHYKRATDALVSVKEKRISDLETENRNLRDELTLKHKLYLTELEKNERN